jgi:hypothetical protein
MLREPLPSDIRAIKELPPDDLEERIHAVCDFIVQALSLRARVCKPLVQSRDVIARFGAEGGMMAVSIATGSLRECIAAAIVSCVKIARDYSPLMKTIAERSEAERSLWRAIAERCRVLELYYKVDPGGAQLIAEEYGISFGDDGIVTLRVAYWDTHVSPLLRNGSETSDAGSS